MASADVLSESNFFSDSEGIRTQVAYKSQSLKACTSFSGGNRIHVQKNYRGKNNQTSREFDPKLSSDFASSIHC